MKIIFIFLLTSIIVVHYTGTIPPPCDGVECSTKEEIPTSTSIQQEQQDEDWYEFQIKNKDIVNSEVSSRIVSSSKKEYASLGNDLTFACCDQSESIEFLDWTSLVWCKEKDDKELHTEDVLIGGSDITEIFNSWKYEAMGNGSYVIRYVTEDDAGTYSFFTKDQPGTILSQVHVMVGQPPEFPEGLPKKTEITIANGGTAYINCSAPNPEWFRDNGIIITSMNITKPKLCRKPSILCTNESGLYECVIRNEYGTNSRKFKVDVIQKPVLLPISPLIISDGGELILPCQIIEGRKTAKHIWSFGNGTTIFNGSKRNPYLTINANVDEDGTLSILGMRSSYPEIYNCTVTNIAGSSYISVDVHVSDYPEWRKR